jgi:mannan polymerase II complex MNN11 subunit
MRNALTLFPQTQFFVFLGQNALIMNKDLSLGSHITSRERLESLMLRDTPVVPPDSVIKTFAHQTGDEVDLILTQDEDGLAQRVFILRQGEWAKFFLDTWFDPLFRSYNFQKAEAHALVRSAPFFALGTRRMTMLTNWLQ